MLVAVVVVAVVAVLVVVVAVLVLSFLRMLFLLAFFDSWTFFHQHDLLSASREVQCTSKSKI